MGYVCEINRIITGEARFFLYEIKQVKTQKNASRRLRSDYQDKYPAGEDLSTVCPLLFQ